MASWEGWTISLVLTEGFLFGQALGMILSQGAAEDLNRQASTELYRSRLQEIFREECFSGARVDVLIVPGEGGFQHYVSGPGGLTRGRREEAASKLYRKAYELWQSQDWLVWKGPSHPQPETSIEN